jgi:hypothetical protein
MLLRIRALRVEMTRGRASLSERLVMCEP